MANDTHPRECSSGLSAFGISLALANWPEGSGAWRHPLRWLANLETAGVAALLAGSARIVAGVLAILTTVGMLVVETAANRYMHRITHSLVRDRVNLSVLSFFALATVLCVWRGVVLTAGKAPVLPRGGFLLAMTLMTECLLVLLPNLRYVVRSSRLAACDRISRDSFGARRA